DLISFKAFNKLTSLQTLLICFDSIVDENVTSKNLPVQLKNCTELKEIELFERVFRNSTFDLTGFQNYWPKMKQIKNSRIKIQTLIDKPMNNLEILHTIWLNDSNMNGYELFVYLLAKAPKLNKICF